MWPAGRPVSALQVHNWDILFYFFNRHGDHSGTWGFGCSQDVKLEICKERKKNKTTQNTLSGIQSRNLGIFPLFLLWETECVLTNRRPQKASPAFQGRNLQRLRVRGKRKALADMRPIWTPSDISHLFSEILRQKTSNNNIQLTHLWKCFQGFVSSGIWWLMTTSWSAVCNKVTEIKMLLATRRRSISPLCQPRIT